MKTLTCEICGSTGLVKQDGVFVCQSCGTKYSVEDAKKMMTEGTVNIKGIVKVDSSDELKNLYEIARRAKEADNNDKAEKYYDMILVKDPNSWEANFYTTYFSAISCKIGEISVAADKVANCFQSTLKLVETNLKGDEYVKAISEITEKSEKLSNLLGNTAIDQYHSIDSQIRDQFTTEYMSHVICAANIMLSFGNELFLLNKESHKDLIQRAWKSGIRLLTKGMDACPMIDPSDSKSILKAKANEYEQKIAHLNPDYVALTHEASGCIVTSIMILSGITSLAACLCCIISHFNNYN